MSCWIGGNGYYILVVTVLVTVSNGEGTATEPTQVLVDITDMLPPIKEMLVTQLRNTQAETHMERACPREAGSNPEVRIQPPPTHPSHT